MIYEANASSSACRLWRLSQVETGAPPTLCDAPIIKAIGRPVKLRHPRLVIRLKRERLNMFQVMNDWLPPLFLVAFMHLRRAEAKAAGREAQGRKIGYARHVTDLAPLREKLQTAALTLLLPLMDA